MHLVVPEALTGVAATILVALGDRFPMIGAHKVLAAYGCLVPRLVTGGFDPTRHRASISPAPEELLHHCREKMPYFAVPRFLGFLPEPRKTPTEKVRKVVLRESGVTPETWDRQTAGNEVKRD